MGTLQQLEIESPTKPYEEDSGAAPNAEEGFPPWLLT